MGGETPANQPLRFGTFELDVRSRQLRNGKTAIRLQEQPFAILQMMLERPGHMVTRDELRQRLWPDGTFVDFEHSLNAAIKRLRAALGDDADHPRFVETLPRRGYRFIGGLEPRKAPGRDDGSTPRARLAVLPFADLSEDAQEYFTDGLTEEMIAQLGRLCRGRVGIIARWSSMLFKGSQQRAREIGHALRADYLLEGSVRRESERVRITARLIEAADETHLWVETYERDLTDCLSVQTDVAARIARSLALELASDDAGTTSPSGSTTTTAYQEYLKGRYHWNMPDDGTGSRCSAALEQALASFNDALRIDPRFAPAHAMVGRVHIARADDYLERPRQALETARAAAKRAVDLEPGLAEAHLAIGDVRRMLEWDWRGAETAYTDAIALNPSQENAHRRLSIMLVSLTRHSEAVREAERARELDPLCLVVSASAALVLYLTGNYDAAMAQCRRTIDLDPQHLPSHRLLAAVSLQTGQVGHAVDVLEAAHRAAPQDPVTLAWLAHATAAAGNRPAATKWMGAIQRLAHERYIPPYHMALAHTGLGDTDRAFAELERATVDCDPALSTIGVEPRFAPLRTDGRYERLRDLLGI